MRKTIKIFENNYIIDEKFKQNWAHYLLQCGMAMVANGIIFAVLDSVFQTVIMAAFGASAFIVFAMPKTINSSPRRLIGGYVVGIVLGVCMYHIATSLDKVFPFGWEYTFFAAITTGVTLLVMTITNTEHPPAAGIAFGITLQGYEATTLLVIFLAIICLSVIRKLLKNWLINLF